MIPERLLANWREWWGEAEAAVVAADVEGRARAALAAFGIRDAEVLAGGEVALVLAADSVVLKIKPGSGEDSDEGRALQWWSSCGAAVPRVLDLRDEGRTILLERVRPGTPLHELTDDPLHTVSELGALARSLRSLPVGQGGFPSLAERMRREVAGLPEAATELEQLISSTEVETLIHFDLHAINALRGPDGYVVIDPEPMVGDPHGECYGLLFGAPADALTGDLAADTELMGRMLRAYARDLEVDRLAAWTSVRAAALHRNALREQDPEWAGEVKRAMDALTAVRAAL